MISNPAVASSEEALLSSIHRLSDAGCSVIQVRTREPVRASMTLRKHMVGGSIPYKEWDVVNGIRTFTTENLAEHRTPGDGKDFLAALEVPLQEFRNPASVVNAQSDKVHYFIYVDPQPFMMNNAMTASLVQQYAAILPTTNVCIIFITPETRLPEVPAGTVLIADFSTPTVEELHDALATTLKNVSKDKQSFPGGLKLGEEDIRKIAYMGLGLSLYEFETYASIAVIEAGEAKEKALTRDRLMSGVAKGKTAVVKQSEILELIHPENMENVGGMGKLKDWITARTNCYSKEAREFGVEPPKGMVLVGVPGTGKSLVAKVTASRLDVPLVKLDFGRVFSKYVGDSESRVREALKMVEGMAPVVLFVDEIDKGLGGAGGGGDSGTSSRVLGSFLTWLQECTAQVFTVVTANRVNGLPPELLRRGRFDQIWSVTLPNAAERREVLEIHLRKRGREMEEEFDAAEISEFVRKSDGYVPAEIESAVKDALVMAFNDDTEGCTGLEMRHLTDALKELIPLSRSHKEQIEAIVQWAASNATPVSYPAPAGGEDAPKVFARGTRRTGR